MKQINMHCRECGAPLDWYVQPGFAPLGHPDRGYVTCPSPESACPLGKQTLDDELYAEKDISAYVRTFERRQKKRAAEAARS